MATDENALICDLAETYNILDYQKFPCSLIAILASGLKDDSRIKLKLQEQKVGIETLLLAGINDRLTLLMQGLSGNKRIRQPYITDELQNLGKRESARLFDTGEEFMTKRQTFLKKGVMKND
ncbi:MAG: hypothetical protein Q4E28_05010 [Clostridia bacterium]|nr:hypothetical protein [Clostridia bacterium]